MGLLFCGVFSDEPGIVGRILKCGCSGDGVSFSSCGMVDTVDITESFLLWNGE